MKKVLDYMLKYSFLLIYFGIFLLCVVGVNKISYAYKLDISENNIIIFIISLLISIALILPMKKFFSLIGKNNKIIFAVSIIVLMLQIIFIYYYYFRTDWDVKTILATAEKLSANEEVVGWNNEYYSYYPNNLFITILFSKIIAFCNLIGLGKYSYFSILVIQSALNVTVGLLLYLTLKKMLDNNSLAWIGYIFYILLIWLSPWVSIPYSDSMGLIFPILILYIYANMKTQYISIIAVLSVIGYAIKPQTIIIVIALIIVDLLYSNKVNIKNILKKSIVFVFVFVICMLGVSAFRNSSSLKIDSEKEISYFHFVKMGLNNVTDGGYLAEDVAESSKIENKKQRQEENIDVIKERLNDYGLMGLFEHQMKKTLNNYNDGTFGWGLEGTFYYKIHENNSPLAKYTRDFYYSDGKYHNYFKYITQGTWLVVLFLMLGNIFGRIKDVNKGKRVIYLSLIGIFLFESIFEARSRYLYTYVPIFILAAMLGLDSAITRSFKKYE